MQWMLNEAHQNENYIISAGPELDFFKILTEGKSSSSQISSFSVTP